VAIARALAIHPRLLLLDEPLSNLDAALRQDVAREMRILQRDSAITTIMVTHDQDEAMAMADRLVVMRDGRVEQVGRQEDLYERPASPFVAGFIGHSNLVAGTLREGRLLAIDGGEVRLAARYGVQGAATLAVRPERIELAAPGSHRNERAVGRVELATYLGAVVEHVVHLGDSLRIVVSGASSGAAAVPRLPIGEAVALCWPPESERLFNGAGGPAATSPIPHPQPSGEKVENHA
jgi:putative spermidine/putrescine transport system ATP-binding protein